MIASYADRPPRRASVARRLFIEVLVGTLAMAPGACGGGDRVATPVDAAVVQSTSGPPVENGSTVVSQGIDTGPLDAGDHSPVDEDVSPSSDTLDVKLQINGADAPCGSCAVVIAQASGGKAPYTYEWSDETLQGPGPHSVCPDEPTVYTVKVTDDSAVESDEFNVDAMVAEVSAEVACVVDDGSWGGCFPQVKDSNAAAGMEECDWQDTDPLLVETLGFPERTAVSFGTEAPLGDEGFVPGKIYEVSYDQLLLQLTTGEPVTVEIWGGNTPCGQEQHLGSLTLDGTWHQSFCFEAEHAWPYVRIDIETGDVLFYLDLAPVATICKGCSLDS